MEIFKRIEYKYNKFVFRVQKLIAFIKLGWNDEDWDHQYLLDILDYKFKAIEKRFTEHQIIQDSKYYAKVARVLHRSLEKAYNDDYHIKYMDKKAPFQLDWKFVPADEPGFTRCIWVKSDTKEELTEQENEAYEKVSKRAYKYHARMKKKYKKIFFRTLYKNLDKLWD
jgi:hypothetical protein